MATDRSFASFTVGEFLDQLASGAPAPGGGAAAALAGSAAAALVSMVCNLTLGRPKFAAVQAEVQRLLSDAEQARARLQAGMDADAAAYGAVIAAMQLPRDAEPLAAQRAAAVQAALRDAVAPPLAAARDCAAVLDLCRRAVDPVNPHAISDVAVAAALADAGLDSALENVEINLRAIKDAAFVAATRAQVAELLIARAGRAAEVRQRAHARMG